MGGTHTPEHVCRYVGRSLGGRLGSNHARMCVSKNDVYGSLFRLQVNGMNEKISFEIGGKFAVPLYVGKVFEIYCMKL